MTNDDTFSPAELLLAYTKRKGYVAEDCDDTGVAGRALQEHEPYLSRVLLSHGPYEDQVYGHWPDFLEEPPGLLATADGVVLTEHGRRLADRWRRETGGI